MAKEDYLCYVHSVGEDAEGGYIVDLYFTEDLDTARGHGWAQSPAFDYARPPARHTLSRVCRCTFQVPLISITSDGFMDISAEFSMEDAESGIVALAWEDASPKDRLVFRHGESYDAIYYLATGKGITFSEL